MCDTRQDWVIENQVKGTEVQPLTVDGKQYEFTVWRRGISAALPYVVGYNGCNLFISDEVPEAYRGYILAHEVREHTTLLSIASEERCFMSLVVELGEVARDQIVDFHAYIRDRSAFFDALVAFYEGDPTQLEAARPGFLEAIKCSQEYLHRLIG